MLGGDCEELVEAAKLDGAGPFQIFRAVTWPALRPTTIIVVAMITRRRPARSVILAAGAVVLGVAGIVSSLTDASAGDLPTPVLLAAVAAVGATGTFVVGAATGMGSSELRHLAAYVVPALLVTVAAMWVTGRLLTRASLAQRFVVVGALGDKPYLTGDAFTPADAYLYVMLTWAKKFGIETGLDAYRDRVAARPSVREAERVEAAG